MADLAPFLTAYLVLVGLVVGSFINLTADRLPRGESVVSPRSHCRSCGRQLNAADLLPVVGYLLRGGRCATCDVAIGAGAPLVEGVCGALVAAAIIWQGLWPGVLIGFLLVAGWGLGVTFVAFGRRARKKSEAGSA